VSRRLAAFLGDERGTAAMELAGVGGLLIFGAMNAADVGRYAYQAQEVNAAAQAGAEAALVACDVDHTPATLNCPGLSAAVTTALQSTRLGSSIQLNSALAEDYYCRTTTGALVKAGAASSKPTDCAGVANAAAGATPTLYLQVNVLFAWQSMFPGLTVAQNFTPTLTRTAWMRMK